MNTRHESFPPRSGSPREIKWFASVETASTRFQFRRQPKHISLVKFHTTDINELKQQPGRSLTEAIYIMQPLCLIWNKVQYILKALLQTTTNIREGFINDPTHTTTKRGVLHDPATHHTSEGLSYMTRTTKPQKNSQPKVSLEHYVGHPTQLSYC